MRTAPKSPGLNPYCGNEPAQTGTVRHHARRRTAATGPSFEALDLAADTGLRISAYTAEPGTPSDDALKLLASWAATLDQATKAPAPDGG